jgi:hypothetical protein
VHLSGAPVAAASGRRGPQRALFARWVLVAGRAAARQDRARRALGTQSFRGGKAMKGRKDANKKKGTLRPWLVDVVVDQLR